MKVPIVIVSIVILAILLLKFYSAKAQNNIESYPYTVDKSYDSFEIRSYEASLFTSVTINSSEYRTASSRGFSVLAGYIFGGNERNEKIAMTSPVSMSLEDSMTMMFMVPRNLKRENLPQPDEKLIKFEEVPAKRVAAIRFSGWADDEKIEAHKSKLIAALDSEGIAYTNKFYFYGYNPPYEVFNRRNEVIVELLEK